MTKQKMLRLGYLACVVVSGAAVWAVIVMAEPVDEVVMTLGQPYEQILNQSRSTLPALTEFNKSNLFVKRPTIFRFSDSHYRFITPPARFLSLYADQHSNVSLVTLSPQIDALPLDESMAILMDLQHQFAKGGWKPSNSRNNHSIKDNEATRDAIRLCSAPTAQWRADDRYQVSLNIRCFRTGQRSNDERYLITLDLGFAMFADPDD